MLKVWLTGVVVSPFFIVLIIHLTETGNGVTFGAYPMGVFAGFIYSVPGALLAWGAVYLVAKSTLKLNDAKLTLSAVGVILTLFAVILFNRGERLDNELYVWTGIYSAVIVGSVWIYKLKFTGNNPEDVSLREGR